MRRFSYARLSWSLRVSAVLVLLGTIACGDGGLSPDGVVRVVFGGAVGPEMYVGDTVRLSATPLGSGGRAMSGRMVSYASSAPTVASVHPVSGLVTAHGPGVARITATCEGASASMELRVRVVPVARVSVTPEARDLHPQWTVLLTVALADAAGRPLVGRPVEFSSSNPDVASVGASGLVTAGALGSATIAVTSEGRMATVLITVTPADVFAISISPAVRAMSDGTILQYSAFPRDERGYTLADRPITWETSDASVAFVSPTGLVSALVPGGVIITARSGAVSASLPLTVRPHVETIALAPIKDTLRTGEFGAVDVFLADAAGNRLVDRDVTLSSSNPGVVAVLSDGRLRAMSAGTAVLTARAEGRSATGTVIVIEKVVFVRLTPSFVTVPKGSTYALTVSILDPRGQELAGRVVTYESSNPNVATVDAAGIVTAVASGTAMITATSEGISSSSRITVP